MATILVSHQLATNLVNHQLVALATILVSPQSANILVHHQLATSLANHPSHPGLGLQSVVDRSSQLSHTVLYVLP